MAMTNKKGRPAVTDATKKTSTAYNFNTIRILRHLILTVPVECAALITLLLLVSLIAAGSQS